MSDTGKKPLATIAARLFAVDPVGLGGVVLRGAAGEMRDRWLRNLLSMLPDEIPVRRVPSNVSEDRLLGGLDLAATLQAGRPVFQQGILSAAHGGLLILNAAERIAPLHAAILAQTIDRGEVETDGGGISAARFGVVALDEGIDDEHPPHAILDRLAFTLSPDTEGEGEHEANMKGSISGARALLASVTAEDRVVEALCAAAISLGIHSQRAVLFALKAAAAAAALDGRVCIEDADVAIAAQLVLAHRATMLPADEAESMEETEAQQSRNDDENSGEDAEKPLEDMVLDSAKAAIPLHILREIEAGIASRRIRTASGRAGAAQKSMLRGRPAGVRQGELRGGRKLNLIATLTAAAPWQQLRRRQNPDAKSRVIVRREDFRITKFKERTATTTIFVVDGSGSAALHRLAEAKGAVELLLAECYVRRDQVALFSFRKEGAELLLPPTRSLARAKRSLAGMPGGGGTPLAAAIEAAASLADSVRRRNQSPVVLFLTDGQANIARDGSAGRAKAADDAAAAAKVFRAQNLRAVVIDTSHRPSPEARRIATELDARYLALPHADAATMQRHVTAAVASR